MLLKGPEDIDAISSKYSDAEAKKFQAIIIADNNGDAILAEKLANELSPDENTKFDEYLDDLEKIRIYKEELNLKLAQSKRNIGSLDGQIAFSEQQRDAVLGKHKDALTAAFNESLNAASSKSNGHTYDSSASSLSAAKNGKRQGEYVISSV